MTPDHRPHPLYVDLDGTLLRSDALWESLLALARRRPALLFALPHRVAQGKAACKRWLAKEAPVDVATLPYDGEAIAIIQERRERGGRTVLATAADRAVADDVAEHLGLFDGVLASDGKTNNDGEAKAAAILGDAGGAAFDYLGDGRDDEAVRRAAATSLVVVDGPASRRASGSPNARAAFERPRLTAASVLAALRSRQWLKNLLVAAPLALSHHLGDLPRLASAGAAFVSFSLCASAAYVLNDLWDLDADRRHPVKRSRPFASGRVRIPDGLALAAASLALGMGVAIATLPAGFSLALAGYVVLTTFYTFRLKRYVVFDVLVVALCYAWRVVAGALATGVRPSGWLLAFSLFFFLSLAFLKRFAELAMRRASGLGGEHGRGYVPGDLEIVRLLGVASGVIAVFVMALYVTNPQVTVLYVRPPLLWAVVLATLYWLVRIWLLAGRGAIKDDPFAFTVGDRSSYATAALMLLVLFLAS
ncbi:MAG TPA: UbiA family prenyltransferase [Candidatus Binatia bacterium]|jgi:4-hydroxybenzoate polyprenyltransferase|nr:UbiA family prenyltransferase [Candidatus Binatia bacterium]